MQDIEVYLFLGLLESGKTKFIQETLEDPRMENGQRTMLLVCEEGEEEYAPEKFQVKNVAKVTLEDISELNMQNLSALAKKYRAERVVVEYNGTWLLQQFFDAMPEDWVIVQMMSFFDSATFLNYNANLRQLVFDKIQMTQMVVFNRYKPEYDKMAFHKVVRGISRRPDIVYEYIGGKAEFDEIEDPLPFDKNAEVIEIEDRDFAWFYRDLGENTTDYVGKTVKFKGMAALSKKAGKDCFILGRHIMTCCEADTAYDGFAVKTGGMLPDVKTRDWVTVTGVIGIEYNSMYRSKGPVIKAVKLEYADPPEQVVATYY